MPTNCLKCLVIVVVILVILDSCGGGKIVKSKKRKVDKRSDWLKTEATKGKVFKNETSLHEHGRGLASSILSLGRVFNFFPVGGERECKPAIDTVARAGICLNPYDCRQRDGKATGDCAHGLGVCCVFEVTCGGVIENNVTYFLSPGFPEAWSAEHDCDVTIRKTHAGIMQLRIDFVQFTIGQPNRTTGVCDEDAMILGEGQSNFTLCGQNYGQHIYYTLSSGSEKREAGELADTKSTRLRIRMRGSDMPRLWLMRLVQMPLAYSAPHDCLQYYTENNGTIKTFNYAYNGRHLASHEYRACVRRNIGFCSVRYTPCDSRSFRIGGGNSLALSSGAPEFYYGPGESGGAGTGFNGTDGAFTGVVTMAPLGAIPPMAPTDTDVAPSDTVAMDTEEQPVQPVETIDGSKAFISSKPVVALCPSDTVMIEDGMMPADGPGTQNDEMEGSGADPNVASPIEAAPAASPGILSRIWSFIFPSWLWGQTGRSWDGDEEREEKLKQLVENWRRNGNRMERKQTWDGRGSEEYETNRGWGKFKKVIENKRKQGQSNKEKDLMDKGGANDHGKTWKWSHWSPYAQHYTKEDDKLRYYGYGKYGAGLGGKFGRQRCQDRITIPCENEYFVSSSSFVPGVCDPHHCGDSFCPGVSFDQCRVETSISPFAVSVHFGQQKAKRNPEENIGACLKYSQLPCDS